MGTLRIRVVRVPTSANDEIPNWGERGYVAVNEANEYVKGQIVGLRDGVFGRGLLRISSFGLISYSTLDERSEEAAFRAVRYYDVGHDAWSASLLSEIDHGPARSRCVDGQSVASTIGRAGYGDDALDEELSRLALRRLCLLDGGRIVAGFPDSEVLLYDKEGARVGTLYPVGTGAHVAQVKGQLYVEDPVTHGFVALEDMKTSPELQAVYLTGEAADIYLAWERGAAPDWVLGLDAEGRLRYGPPDRP